MVWDFFVFPHGAAMLFLYGLCLQNVLVVLLPWKSTQKLELAAFWGMSLCKPVM